MVKFVAFENSQDPDFTAVINIYQEAFPLSERIANSWVKQRIDNGDYKLFVGYQEKLVAFMAILSPITDTQFVLLAYIATQANYRNQGIGSKFLNYILPKLQQQEKYLLLEVENPQYGDDPQLRERRLNFYRRIGAQQLKNVRFAIPPLAENSPVEMLLMIAPPYHQKSLSEKIVKKMITWLFVVGYQGSPDSTLLTELLNEVEEIVELI
ncbi:MAG: GNAT family N-acetyltransferase [Spirulinaceae cyanobacterium]